MTHDEARANAEGMAMYLKANFPPAEAMMILSKLVAQLLHAATPNASGAIDKSITLLMTDIGAEMQHMGEQRMGGFVQ